ncbi:hypothetical protein B0H10DRAFT_1940443 [Mycena sp. CBHHK59/15]|nr:hypothetical protein B0H10DRAFT_1940443 [Mycena sp. CBHHK59/15]
MANSPLQGRDALHVNELIALLNLVWYDLDTFFTAQWQTHHQEGTTAEQKATLFRNLVQRQKCGAGNQNDHKCIGMPILQLSAVLKDELRTVQLNVLAKSMRQKKEQAEKLAATISANAGTEMADGAQTVRELLKAEIKAEFRVEFKSEMQKYQGSKKPDTQGSSAVASSSRGSGSGGKMAKKPHPARETSTNTTQSNTTPLGKATRGGGGNGRGNSGTNWSKQGWGR